jgi:hypothetical protein
MKVWSIAINEDEGDIEAAPLALAKTLMPAKHGIKNPFRENNDKPIASDTNPTVHPPQNHPFHPQSYPQLPYGFFPFNAPSPYQQLPPAFPPSPYTKPMTKNLTPRPSRHNDRSSSLPSEADLSCDKLEEYLNWLARVNPTMSEQLLQCLETLRRHDIVFGTIENVSDALFDKWDISDGIRLLPIPLLTWRSDGLYTFFIARIAYIANLSASLYRPAPPT